MTSVILVVLYDAGFEIVNKDNDIRMIKAMYDNHKDQINALNTPTVDMFDQPVQFLINNSKAIYRIVKVDLPTSNQSYVPFQKYKAYKQKEFNPQSKFSPFVQAVDQAKSDPFYMGEFVDADAFQGSGIKNIELQIPGESVKKQVHKFVFGSDLIITPSGRYGDLKINMDKLINDKHLLIKKDKKIIMDEPTDKTMIKLLTKLYNDKRYKYTNTARSQYCFIFMKSGLPIVNSKKIKEIVNPLSHYVSDKGLMERSKDLIAEIKIGNKSNSAINELDQVLSILIQRKVITQVMRRDTF